MGGSVRCRFFMQVQNFGIFSPYDIVYQRTVALWTHNCRATKCSIHNMLRWSILCTLHTQYATRGAYCVGSVHMLFQLSSEGTQYALLENMSRGMFAFLSNCPLDIHLSILRTLYLKPCPHHNCIIVVFNPHQQHFGDVVSKFGFFPDMKSTFGNRSKEKWGNARG